MSFWVYWRECIADFVFGDKKIGGNAQAISGGRWVHHTSFLYDYTPDRMDLLKHPPKSPEYRLERKHTDFLTSLKHFVPSRQHFVEGIISSVSKYGGFVPVPGCWDEVECALRKNTLCGTKVLE